MMLKLKFQYFGHLTRSVDSLEKTLMLGGIGGKMRRGQQRMRWWMASLTQWTWVWVNSRSWWCHSTIFMLYHPLLLLPSIFPSIRVFSNESVLQIRGPKYWSFSFNISPSNEYSGLISFRMDWLNLLEFEGTPKSLLQHHSSKASVLWTQLSL